MIRLAVAAVLSLALPAATLAQPPDRAAIAAQVEALKATAWMDGTWRGPATFQTPGGPLTITQTERVGPMLGGAIRLVEGKGYMANGMAGFNAFGVIAFDPQTRAYIFQTHAQGHAGNFPLTVTPTGWAWSLPMGEASLRYTTTLVDGKWHEIGERIVPGQKPVTIFEMTLVRIGDTDWPGAGAVPAK
ncbi:DUF1579 domain-containing protein [Sphingomonas naphthae]|uniref:DUF1579 domain-containing protein n=1 Tax=Sphingomonas naphthae TaxID=1813468 RepID=A0ABY7TN86_9SPHN|nr:DUF1579 domain-containing protein [Sphingomonas naphthae]WCT74702.1 DUF1579 domain-containing protein [Sphingomonas naphthae]